MEKAGGVSDNYHKKSGVFFLGKRLLAAETKYPRFFYTTYQNSSGFFLKNKNKYKYKHQNKIKNKF